MNLRDCANQVGLELTPLNSRVLVALFESCDDMNEGDVIPQGHMFAGVLSKGINLHEFNLMLAALEIGGVIERNESNHTVKCL